MVAGIYSSLFFDKPCLVLAISVSQVFVREIEPAVSPHAHTT